MGTKEIDSERVELEGKRAYAEGSASEETAAIGGRSVGKQTGPDGA